MVPRAEPTESKAHHRAFSPRASNLRLRGDAWQQLGRDMPGSGHAAAETDAEVWPQLTWADLRRLNVDNKAFLESHAGLTPEDMQKLSPLVSQDANAWQRFIAGCAAGGASYTSAFFPGKVLGNYLGMVIPRYSAYIYVIFASFLHAFVGENIGGGLRGNYGAYPSPDAAATANYTTAMAALNAARVSGDARKIKQCETDLHTVTEGLLARMRQQDEAGTPLWCLFKDNPVLSAHLRAMLSDEFPYFWYIIAYGISGSALPYERRDIAQLTHFAGKPLDQSDRALMLASVDIIVAGLLGVMAGMLTVLTQNALRRRVQHVTKAPAGLHSPEVRDSHLRRARERLAMLTEKYKKLCELELLVEQQQALGEMASGKAQRLLPKIRSAIERNQAAQNKERADLKQLRSAFGRNRKAIRRGFATTVAGKPKNPVEFLNRSRTAMPLRTTSKWLGNATALLPFAYFVTYVGALYAQHMPLDHLAPGNATSPNPFFDSPESQQQYIEQGIQQVLFSSSMAGTALITAWWLRYGTTPLIERTLGRAAGYVTRARNALSGAAAPQMSQDAENVTIHVPQDASSPVASRRYTALEDYRPPTIVVEDPAGEAPPPPPGEWTPTPASPSAVPLSPMSLLHAAEPRPRPNLPHISLQKASAARTAALMQNLLEEYEDDEASDASEADEEDNNPVRIRTGNNA